MQHDNDIDPFEAFAPLKVLVCGGRDFEDWDAVKASLNAIDASHGIHTVIHGCATGADALSSQWAKGLCRAEWRFPADWNHHGKSAGLIRNKDMLESAQPDLVIAFKGGSGTAHMVKIAKESGFRVRQMWEPAKRHKMTCPAYDGYGTCVCGVVETPDDL